MRKFVIAMLAIASAVLAAQAASAPVAGAAQATINSTGCGHVNAGDYAKAVAWRWNPAAGWERTSRENREEIWLSPFAPGWIWTWTRLQGWLAMPITLIDDNCGLQGVAYVNKVALGRDCNNNDPNANCWVIAANAKIKFLDGNNVERRTDTNANGRFEVFLPRGARYSVDLVIDGKTINMNQGGLVMSDSIAWGTNNNLYFMGRAAN